MTNLAHQRNSDELIYLRHLMCKQWQFFNSVIDGEDLYIDGLNIWEHSWKNSGNFIAVKDPIYSQEYTMNVYEITSGNKTIVFAAGEFSNLVWGIYLPL